MPDLAAAFGRSDAMAYHRAGVDPFAAAPCFADAVQAGRFRETGQTAFGKRWSIYAGNWATPVLAVGDVNPHLLLDTGRGAFSALLQTTSTQPWSAGVGFADWPDPIGRVLRSGNTYFALRSWAGGNIGRDPLYEFDYWAPPPFPRLQIALWDASRVYRKDDCVTVLATAEYVFRSLRDGNVGNAPGTIAAVGAGVDQNPALASAAPDWWQLIQYRAAVGMGFNFPEAQASISPPGVANWTGYLAVPRAVWKGRPFEANVRVGADQWASGECQADWIGPAVRGRPDSQDAYCTRFVYDREPALNDIEAPFRPDASNAVQVTEEPGRVCLIRVNGGVETALTSWHVTPARVHPEIATDPEMAWIGSDVKAGSDGPWSVLLSVSDDAQGRPVISVWTRFWGYDPYGVYLDVYPWKFQGSYVDTSGQALRSGQPGFMVWNKPYREGFVDGESWWGWGEMGGLPADTSSYMLSAASRLSAPVVPNAGDVAFSTPVYNVDDGTSDSASITDSNSVSIISPASAGATDATSSADSSTCRLIVPASVAAPFLLTASLLVAVLYDTATADTGAFADAVAISQPARQTDTSTGEDLSVIGLGVPVADSSSALDAASASVGRFSAAGDSTTTADSVGSTLSLQSAAADVGVQSDSVACELIFPATIDVSDATSSADGTAIVAAIGQADSSAQSDIAYGYIGQFASADDATASTDGVGISITTGVWIPPAEAPRIKLALGGPVIRLRFGGPEIDVDHAGGPLIRLSLLEEL